MTKRIFIWVMTVFTVACGSNEKVQDPAATDSTKASSSSAAPSSVNADAKSMAESNTQAQAAASEAALQKVAPPILTGWGYEGINGPETWGDLKPEYLLCRSGKKQSPVDLKWAKPKGGGDISFQYRPEPLKVMDTGYTVEIGLSGSSAATLHGKNYSLHHVQFRTSSEHALSGNLLPMEAQFFHKSSDGDLAAVSVILIQGKENAALKDVFEAVPKMKGVVTEKPEIMFDPGKLLPDRLTHYHYVGSLTTPPCTEGVSWFVLNTPVEISKEQILQFRKLYTKNNRPLQPLNGRKVVNY